MAFKESDTLKGDSMCNKRFFFFLLLSFVSLQAGIGLTAHEPSPAHKKENSPQKISLEARAIPGRSETMLVGDYEVFEDRKTRRGRKINLHITILPATGPEHAPDPIFFLAGGPGQAATSLAAMLASSPLRRNRDIVLVDQRGTGRSNPLQCNLSGSLDDLQGYLDELFSLDALQKCREELQKIADLRLYTTPIAMDDLNEVRQALRYDKINLMGGSYGTRAALVYMRRHPESVRAAVIKGVAPIAFTNPLHHARGAQDSLDLIFEECLKDTECNRAFPNLKTKFDAIAARLKKGAVDVSISHPTTRKPALVKLSYDAFAEGLRVMTYSSSATRLVPLMIDLAYGGNYGPFTERALASNRALREQLHFGMLLSVVCAEDVPRIDPKRIEQETAGTYLGDVRVRGQMAVCDIWPRGEVPASYGQPVRASTPTLVISGKFDPVTPPRWGAEAARHLPNSLHVITPNHHDLSGPCIDSMTEQFLASASVKGLDTSCAKMMRRQTFRLSLSQ